ncbi:hypothetical protein QBC39DRAFT_365448 [Podospora conica]|nr:hypothetical protein QBC39DRAFT_365448 [Schizothecium conicum]
MHFITTILTPLLLSATLTTALPATSPPRNLPALPTSGISPHAKRQKLVQPSVLVAPDLKPGWKRSDITEAEPTLVARGVENHPSNQGSYRPVRVSEAVKARDVEGDVEGPADGIPGGVEKRQTGARPRVLPGLDRKMGGASTMVPVEGGDNSGVVARQVKSLPPVRSTGREGFW